MPLSAGKPVLQLALVKAFADAMKVFREFDQDGNSGVDKFNPAVTAASLKFGEVAAPAIDAFIKTGLVSTAVVTTGSEFAQAGTGTGAVT